MSNSAQVRAVPPANAATPIAKNASESFDFLQDSEHALGLVAVVGSTVGAIQRSIGHEIALCVTFIGITAKMQKALKTNAERRAAVKKQRKEFLDGRLTALCNEWLTDKYKAVFSSLVWSQTTRNKEPAEMVEAGPFQYIRTASENYLHVSQTQYSRVMWAGWLHWFLKSPTAAMEAVKTPDSLGAAIQKVLNGVNAAKAAEKVAQPKASGNDDSETEVDDTGAPDTTGMPEYQAEAVNMAQSIVTMIATSEGRPEKFFEIAKAALREIAKVLHEAASK